MLALGLNIVELLEIVRVCGSLQLDKCPASYLSDFLAVGLAGTVPDLAAKLRHFDEEDLEALCECIKGVQSSLRSFHSPEAEPSIGAAW
jgi:hypothetical protein